MGGVHGDPLGSVHGRGVAQLHVPFHVLRGEHHAAAVAVVDDVEGSVGADAGNRPEVAVLHDVASSVGGELAVVLAGDDAVADVSGEPVAQRDRGGALDRAGAEAVRLGAGVELVHARVLLGEHHGLAAVVGVPLPCSEHRLRHPLSVPAHGAAVVEVPGERVARRGRVAQQRRRGRLVGVDETVDGLKVDGADLVLDEAQRPASLHRGELPVVADHAHVRARELRQARDLGQLDRAGHARLVDHDHVAGMQSGALGQVGALHQ